MAKRLSADEVYISGISLDAAAQMPGGSAGAGGATAANQATQTTQLGSVTETAPATDIASSGLNGRLQRIAQRLTSLLTGIVLAAGENLIGKVAGTASVVIPTITVDTAAYAAGDTVGGKITLANAVRISGGSSLLYSIHIFDRSNQKPTGNILIFNANPTAATTTDNAAFVYSTDDFKQITRIPVVAADYATVNSKASAGLVNIGRMVKATTGTSLYAVFVTDGAPDFVAGTDLQIIFNFIPVD